MTFLSSLLATFPLLFSDNGAVVATEVQKPSSSVETSQASQTKPYTSRLEIGADYTHVHLKPHGHTSFNGDMGGLQGSYQYFSESHFYAGVTLAWKQGNVHGSAGRRSLLYIDTQERVGYTASLDSMKALWTFFSGLGFRYLGQELHYGGGLSFNYSEFYVPVGIAMDYKINSWFDYRLNFTWMPQIFPTVWIDPLRGASWSLTKQIANFMVEMPFDFTLTDNHRWHLMITPFYEYWQDGKSTAKTTTGLALGVPRNTYQFYGVNVSFAYCF